MNYPSGELVTLYKLILETKGIPSVTDVKGYKYTIGVKVPAGGHDDPSMTFTGSIDLVPNDQFYEEYDKRAGYNYYRSPGLGKMVKEPYVYKWYEDPYYYDDDDWYDDYDYYGEDWEALQEKLEK